MNEPPSHTSRESRADGSASPFSAGALQIGSALGIPIRIHFTFLLLIAWYVFVAVRAEQSVVASVAFILLVFGCVALHELGHAAMAKRFGVRTEEIVLYPIGGVARLERMPEGVAELLIAAAGPVVNVVLAALLFMVIVGGGFKIPVRVEDLEGTGGFLFRLFLANVALFVFNLVPAFPMDGGRILRALLSLTMPEERATGIAAAVGRGIAILLGIGGFFLGQPLLILIALFVFLGASQEALFSRTRAQVIGRTAHEAMITRFEVLAPQDSLGRAADLLLSTHQQDFPVVDAWHRVAGVLSRTRLLEGLAQHGREGAVLEIMDRGFATVSPSTPLDDVLRAFQSSRGSPVLVLADTGLVGMITFENLAEFIEVSRKVRASEAASRT